MINDMATQFNENGSDQLNCMGYPQDSENPANQLLPNTNMTECVSYYNLRNTPARRTMSEERRMLSARRQSIRGRPAKRSVSANLEVIVPESNSLLGVPNYSNQPFQNFGQQGQDIAQSGEISHTGEISQNIWNTMDENTGTQQLNTNVGVAIEELDINYNNPYLLNDTSKQQLSTSTWGSVAGTVDAPVVQQKQAKDCQYMQQENFNVETSSSSDVQNSYNPNQITWTGYNVQTNVPSMPQEQPVRYQYMQNIMAMPPPPNVQPPQKYKTPLPIPQHPLPIQQTNEFPFKKPLLPTPRLRMSQPNPASNYNVQNFNRNSCLQQPPMPWNAQNNYTPWNNYSSMEGNAGRYQQSYNEPIHYQNVGNSEQETCDNISYQYAHQNPTTPDAVAPWSPASVPQRQPCSQETARQQVNTQTQQFNATTQQCNPQMQQLNLQTQQLNSQIQQINSQKQQLYYQTQMLNPSTHQFNTSIQQHNQPIQQQNPSIQQQTPSIQQHNFPIQQHNTPIQQFQSAIQQFNPPAQQLSSAIQQFQAPIQLPSPSIQKRQRTPYREGTPALPVTYRKFPSREQREMTPQISSENRVACSRTRERVFKREDTPCTWVRPDHFQRTFGGTSCKRETKRVDMELQRNEMEQKMRTSKLGITSTSSRTTEEFQVMSSSSTDKKNYPMFSEQYKNYMMKKNDANGMYSKLPCGGTQCDDHGGCVEAEAYIRHLNACSFGSCKICDVAMKVCDHVSKCIDRLCDEKLCRKLKRAIAAEKEKEEMKEIVELEQQLHTHELFNVTSTLPRLTEEDITDFMKYLN